MYEQEEESGNLCGPSLCLCVCLFPTSIVSIFFFIFFCLGFKKNKKTLKICPSLSLAVRFVDCGRGGLVRFESSNPSDFRIEADGIVYAARSIQHSALSALPLVIKAIDTTTQQQWVTQVRLSPATVSGQQVNSS